MPLAGGYQVLHGAALTCGDRLGCSRELHS
jgi:hypothetical protein